LPYRFARSSISASSSSRKGGSVFGSASPAEPRFGITKACRTARRELARSLTTFTVSAASASGSGLSASGEVGTQESTDIVVAESR
jgi:hypothetical protein